MFWKHTRRNLGALATCLAITSAQAAEWHQDAIWYQIFPERFRNGDVTNDPVRDSLQDTWPYLIPEGWQVSPWTSDWYRRQPWESVPDDFYHHAQLRRYGGDLQGVLEKLGYLEDLGVNALYFNPVFESPSLHKYGATFYHHIDKHFGPDPAGDLAQFAREDPSDPSTWTWTAADQLFLTLIKEAHRRGMKIIIDGVFNHVGIPFWAFQTAKREGPESRFANWFRVESWDDPTTPEDEFHHEGWAGVKDLPEFRKDENGPHPDVKAHFRAIVKRWMDPNGDGDPSDGIDGWRLDVAAEVPLAFWEEFRGWVLEINPEAYLTGEIWWQDYQNHELANAKPWLGAAFDGVMNYRFADAAFGFVYEEGTAGDSDRFIRLLTGIHADYGYERSLVLQNLLDSHDVARVASAVMNPSARLDHAASVKHLPDYHIGPPNAEGCRKLRQLLALQFVSPGAPYLYYGTEAGMWGADDPDCRKPMVWPDLQYATEQAHPNGKETHESPVAFDSKLFAFCQNLTRLRTEQPIWRRGSFAVVAQGGGWLAFERRYGTHRAIVVVNASSEHRTLTREQLHLASDTAWQRQSLANAESTTGEFDSDVVLVEARAVDVFSLLD